MCGVRETEMRGIWGSVVRVPQQLGQDTGGSGRAVAEQWTGSGRVVDEQWTSSGRVGDEQWTGSGLYTNRDVNTDAWKWKGRVYTKRD